MIKQSSRTKKKADNIMLRMWNAKHFSYSTELPCTALKSYENIRQLFNYLPFNSFLKDSGTEAFYCTAWSVFKKKDWYNPYSTTCVAETQTNIDYSHVNQ